MVQAFFEKDEAAKAEKSTQIAKETVPKYLDTLEKIIKENPTSSGWLFGSKLTYVDLNLYLVVDFMKLFKKENIFDSCPGVEKLTKQVAALPNIASWLEKRPERTFGPPVA